MADSASTSYVHKTHGSAPAILDVEEPEIDEPEDRRYRNALACAVELAGSFVEEEGGLFTRKGTLRIEVVVAGIAAYLKRRSDEADSDALVFDSGEWAAREEGTFIKSVQGFAEDLWSWIYKRPVPEGDPLREGDFRRFYDRVKRALDRSDLLADEGSPIRSSSKIHRDQHGKRWALSDRLREAQRGRETAEEAPFVRCTGKPTGDALRAERAVARRYELHREFTHAGTARRYNEAKWRHGTASGRRYEKRYSREGADASRHVTVGRWRSEAVGRRDRHEQAVRCSWVVFELDAETWEGNDKLARRLCRRLKELGVDLSAVLVAYSGNKSLHVRVPDGALGCPIYRSSRAAQKRLKELLRRVAGTDEELRGALDFGLASPGHEIRVIGSVHESTGRQTVATTGDRFLDAPPSFLRALSESEYTAPKDFPLPRRAEYAPELAALLVPNDGENDTENGAENGGQNAFTESERRTVLSGYLWSGVDPSAVRSGVEEGCRNDCCLWMAHVLINESEDQRTAWQRLQTWNKRNDPPLGLDELQATFEQAVQFQIGRVGEYDGGDGGKAMHGRRRGGGRVFTVWGDTFKHRDTLKENGFWWNPDEGVWRTKSRGAFRHVIESEETGISAIPAGRNSARIPEEYDGGTLDQ